AAGLIKKEFPNVKIIMLSSVNTEDEVLSAMAAGAGGYCLKESNPERLFTAIKAVQEGDLWMDSAIAGLGFQKLKSTPNYAASQVRLKKEEPPQQKPEQKTDKYAVMSAEELKLLGLMVEGHSHDKLAQKLSLDPNALRQMQNGIMNKIAVLE